MKRSLSLLLALVLTFSLCIGLISCGNSNNPSGDNPSGDNPGANKPSNEFTLDLEGYVANIGNATALGISKKSSTGNAPISLNYKANSGFGTQCLSTIPLVSDKDTESKNYIVMATTEYDANVPAPERPGAIGTLNFISNVSFTKTVTKNVTTETTGTKYIFSTDGTISILAVEGFKYSVYMNDTLIHSELQDNDTNDANDEIGVIVIDNLTVEVEYRIEYKGIGVETTITQDELNAEVDKLYIFGEYTFISFVPKGMSPRPTDDMLAFDTDGIALYDKCDYFSNSTRQSFIINNTTGYIYKINGFNIKEIQGGCLLSADDNFIYDFKINEKDEIEIFSLFTNDTIEWYSCFKDKYRNKFIQNNRLNTYDSTTNTYFYVHEPYVNSEYEQYNNYVIYELTSNNEAIALYYSDDQTAALWSTLIGASIILENGEKRNLTSEDNFDIYYDWDKFNKLSYFKRYNINGINSFEQDWTGWRADNRAAYKVRDGVVYGYSHHKGYSDGLVLMQYDAVRNEATYLSLLYSGKGFVNTSNLEENDIIIEFHDGELYYYSNIWQAYKTAAVIYNGHFATDSGSYLSDYESFTANLVLENCSIDGIKDAVMAYGVNGNTYYDIVAEKVNNEIVIKQYVKGTYQKPQVKIILQPLNKNT